MTSTATAAPETSSKALRRRQGLAPYLQIVEDAVDPSVGSIAAPEGFPQAPSVTLDPWAVGWLRASATAPAEPEQLPELLRQTLAFLVKGAADSVRLKQEEPRAGADFFAVQAELMLDSAVGMALQREIQKAVNDLVAAGNVNDARSLAKLQGRVRTSVRELKQCITESNRGRDEDLVQHLTDEAERNAPAPETRDPKAPAGTRAAVTQPAPVAAPRIRRRSVRALVPTARPSLRTTILLVLVGAGFMVWLGARAMHGLGQREMRILTRNDFVRSAPIRQVVSRPPSAYVVVDALGWAAFDEGQQLRFVDSMAGVLQRYGYWGMTVQTSEGVPAAQWLEERGSRLLHDAPALVTPEPAKTENFNRFVP